MHVRHAAPLVGFALLAACGDDTGTTTSASAAASTSAAATTDGSGPGTTTNPTTGPASTSTSTSGESATGTGTTDDPADPTSSPGTTTDPGSTSIATTGPSECMDGAEQCKDGVHQVCVGGAWTDSPCAGGEFCDEVTESCQPCACMPGATGMCVDANNIETCADDCSALVPQPCPNGQVCADDTCQALVCAPNAQECVDGNTYHVCNGSGTMWGDPVDCPAKTVCDFGQCVSACEQAMQVKSNVGCEFWAADMSNLPPRDTYVFAVSVSNPSFDTPANIEIFDRNGGNEQKIITGQVAPRQVKVFNLSGSSNGQQGYYTGDAGILGSGIVKGRAFRVASDYPVVAVQFNPIGGAAGYTTDASLLLPTHVLGKSHLHLAWDKGYGSGSTMAIVATEDATTVTITPKVNTAAGANGLPAMQAGVPTNININKYDYIQVTPGNLELSGSAITSTAPVALFGGHTCANVPNTGTGACDHVEEQIFPLETWGKNYVAARNPKRGNEPMLWRILASEDNTAITFDPPGVLGPQITLNKGQMVEFQEQGDFYISADDPILVAGYMLGCSATGVPGCPGDPYMLLMVPVEQYQSDYVYLVDSSYTQDWTKLVRTAGSKVSLGCFGNVPDNRWTKIGNSTYEWAVIDMNPGEAMCKTGTNEASGDAGFGVFVSGTSAAASYGYPGGLALKLINPQ